MTSAVSQAGQQLCLHVDDIVIRLCTATGSCETGGTTGSKLSVFTFWPTCMSLVFDKLLCMSQSVCIVCACVCDSWSSTAATRGDRNRNRNRSRANVSTDVTKDINFWEHNNTVLFHSSSNQMRRLFGRKLPPRLKPPSVVRVIYERGCFEDASTDLVCVDPYDPMTLLIARQEHLCINTANCKLENFWRSCFLNIHFHL